MRPRSGNHVVVVASVEGRGSAGGHAWAITQWACGLQRNGVTTHVRTVPSGRSHLPSQAPIAVQWASVGDPVVLRIMGANSVKAFDPTAAVFLDIDPGYPQLWHQLGLADMFEGHDRFVTIGENIGRASCTIPDCGLDWITTPPPVDLDAWPAVRGGTRFTTVATWRNPYGTVTWNGKTYGSRVHEFRKFIELPRLVDADFELALDIHPAETDDLALLERNGWRLVDPRRVAGTPDAYRSYIQGSAAEFCVAQNIYVETRSGWISDRSLCYLASGKPVLAQDTGFSDNYPVGEGLIPFTTLEEAAAGVEEIQQSYERHSKAARELAEQHFDARKVMARLLERLELPVGVATS
jgi:hypothetical protein